MSRQQWRAEAVIQLQDQQLSAIKVVNLALKATRRSATAKKIRAAMHFANRGFVTACCFLQTLLGISLLRWLSGRNSDRDKASTRQGVVPRGER